MRILKRSLIGLYLFGLVIALLLMAAGVMLNALRAGDDADENKRPQRERVIATKVLKMVPTSVTPEFVAFGELRSERVLELRTSASGRILYMADAFKDGGVVSEGTPLLRIDKADAQSALTRAEADLNDVQSDEAEALLAYDIISQELTAAKAQFTLRQKALDRQVDLQSRGSSTRAAVETSELALSSAKQAMLAKESALSKSKVRVDQSAARLLRAELSVSDAQRRLDDTEITAPFAGAITNVMVLEGGLVSQNERIGTIFAPDMLEVSFRVSAGQFARLLDEAGQLLNLPVEVRLESGNTRLRVTGKITREDAMVADGTSGRMIFASLEAATRLRAGDFVSVHVQEPVLENVVALPSAAVFPDGTVLVMTDEERLERKTVPILRRSGNTVIVSPDGLEGRYVVAAQNARLGSGLKIKPVGPDFTDVAPSKPAAGKGQDNGH
ncbi:MAG: efflux RND transporter periplasmic adaptor subunit [Halocynthiibacter sp.]